MYCKCIKKGEGLYFDTKTLFFSNPLIQKSFTETFNAVNCFGNLTGFLTSTPIIVLDLAPDFNIKNEFKEQKEEMLIRFQEAIEEFPYFTTIYKDKNINKNAIIIDESEYAYNNILSTYNEIIYVLDNIYQNKKDIIIIHFGKFAEYKYLLSMLNYRNWDKKLYSLYCKHSSNYIEKGFSTNKNYKNDILKIKKILEEHKNVN